MTKFEVMPEEVEDLTPIPKDKKIDDTDLICFFEEVWAVADEARAPPEAGVGTGVGPL